MVIVIILEGIFLFEVLPNFGVVFGNDFIFGVVFISNDVVPFGVILIFEVLFYIREF